jgi:ADP-ribosyl-[dinitrogen reductase] hydrolase
MALCIAECVGESDGSLDFDDLVARYSAWVQGPPKDIGHTTLAALARAGSASEARANAEAYAARTGRSAGNGTVMRVAPLAFAPLSDSEVVRTAREEARLTHADDAAADASAALCAACRAISRGEEPISAASEEARHGRITHAVAIAQANDLTAAATLAGGAENGTCWAALAVALCSLSFDSYEDGVTWAISLGKDTDTNAAIAGALMGCRDGVEAIPSRWLDSLLDRQRIDAAIDRLGALNA